MKRRFPSESKVRLISMHRFLFQLSIVSQKKRFQVTEQSLDVYLLVNKYTLRFRSTNRLQQALPTFGDGRELP